MHIKFILSNVGWLSSVDVHGSWALCDNVYECVRYKHCHGMVIICCLGGLDFMG
jgi:hypothetical protein